MKTWLVIVVALMVWASATSVSGWIKYDRHKEAERLKPECDILGGVVVQDAFGGVGCARRADSP